MIQAIFAIKQVFKLILIWIMRVGMMIYIINSIYQPQFVMIYNPLTNTLERHWLRKDKSYEKRKKKIIRLN